MIKYTLLYILLQQNMERLKTSSNKYKLSRFFDTADDLFKLFIC